MAGKIESQAEDVSNPIFAIGYSNLPIAEFIDLLKLYGIQMVIDVRTIPKSRYQPDYNQEDLKNTLKLVKIGYRHMRELGGLRHASKDSSNTGWINPPFRGFADYMQTQEFQKGLKKLEKIAQKKRCVLMCAEGNPLRCHRSLIADALSLKNGKPFMFKLRKHSKLTASLRF